MEGETPSPESLPMTPNIHELRQYTTEQFKKYGGETSRLMLFIQLIGERRE